LPCSSRLFWSIITCSLIAGCDGAPQFKSTDITGAPYGHTLELADHHGKPRRLEDWRGKVVVLFFGFTHCPDICPTTLADIAQAVKTLGPDAERVQVALAGHPETRKYRITVEARSGVVTLEGTAAMDDEGTATQRTVLIEKGILKTYLSDRKHAEKLGIRRSGNARRESFRHLPICRMTNTMIASGESDPEEIVRSVKDGIFVKKMGGGQVDVVSGNFAFEVTECYRIREGRLAEPLRGATLVGQGPKLMSEIDMVGWDLGYSTGTCGKDGQGAPVADAQPTLRIPSVVIGGKIQ